MSPPAAIYLSTSRINRVLRPLRNKCATLKLYDRKVLGGRVSGISNTYSTRSNTTLNDNSANIPPLHLLQRPDSVSSRILLETGALELSKQIYSIADCFKNIVKVVLDARRKESCKRTRVMALGALCAEIVGSNLQLDIETLEDKNEHDEEMMEMLNDLYESVPAHYRSWTLMTHALSIVLSLCPHHPTLLQVLLQICISSSLFSESCTILRALLVVATIPASRSATPRICHPAHSSYLVDLLSMWSATPVSNTHDVSSHDFNNRSFTRIFVDVVSDGSNLNIWTCKAVAKLARELRREDIISFAEVTVGLTYAIRESEQRIACQKVKGTPSSSALSSRLFGWMGAFFDRLVNNVGDTAVMGDFMEATLRFLSSARTAEWHKRLESRVDQTDLADISVCLATFCLGTQLSQPGINHSATNAQIQELVGYLREAKSTTSTFNDFVLVVVFPDDCLRAADWPDHVIRTLSKFADALQSHSLLSLEASLCARALHHVECSFLLPHSCRDSHSKKQAEQLRNHLIDKVHDAESRCFGLPAIDDGNSAPRVCEVGRVVSENDAHWVWEDMVESWIRASPFPKRRKVDLGKGKSSREFHPISLPMRHSCPSTNGRKNTSELQDFKLTSTQSPVKFPSECSRTTTDLLPADADRKRQRSSLEVNRSKENQTSRPTLQAPKPPRRSYNFSSILSDSLMNRVILHPREKKIVAESHQPSTPLRQRPMCSDLLPATPVPMSDDALDLFACAQSSPAFR